MRCPAQAHAHEPPHTSTAGGGRASRLPLPARLSSARLPTRLMPRTADATRPSPLASCPQCGHTESWAAAAVTGPWCGGGLPGEAGADDGADDRAAAAPLPPGGEAAAPPAAAAITLSFAGGSSNCCGAAVPSLVSALLCSLAASGAASATGAGAASACRLLSPLPAAAVDSAAAGCADCDGLHAPSSSPAAYMSRRASTSHPFSCCSACNTGSSISVEKGFTAGVAACALEGISEVKS